MGYNQVMSLVWVLLIILLVVLILGVGSRGRW